MISNSSINVNLVSPIYFADKETNAQIISVICHRMSQLQRHRFSSFLLPDLVTKIFSVLFLDGDVAS